MPLSPMTVNHVQQATGPNAEDVAYPVLTTRRFRFRPFVLADIAQMVSIAGRHRIADTTIGVPHPYTPEFARLWILTHTTEWAQHRALHWAVVVLGGERVVGYAGLLKIDRERAQAQLSYWVGDGVERSTDAAEWSAAIVEYALRDLKLKRIYSLQLARHPVAGRVLAAIGMQREGLVRKRLYKEGLLEDVVCWAISNSSASSPSALNASAT